MLKLDVIIDTLEQEIATRGVLAIDLLQIAPGPDVPLPARERSGILIEMLRVWMEHRWQAGHPVTVMDCLKEFPKESFTEDDLNCLRFEEQRLRQNSQATVGKDLQGRSIDELPNVGERWGEFELLSILGIGAFAKVYLARQQGLSGRLVALKLTFRKNHESHWLATLQHSAIVPIYSTHCHDEVNAICMPFLGNTTLADLLKEVPKRVTVSKLHWWSTTNRTKQLGGNAMLSTIQQRHHQIETIIKTGTSDSPASAIQSSDRDNDNRSTTQPRITEVNESSTSQTLIHCDYVDAICWIGSQLADALAYAHRNGVVHSDIKPANVLIAFDGQPRLLDFNVSYQGATESLKELSVPVGGTIPYMSPEHRQSFERTTIVDGRSDVYSLGVVLFEMLTGKLPKAREGKIDDVRRWNSAVSPAMSAIVTKCLAPDPNFRYQSADALRDDLSAQYRHEPLVHLTEPSKLERVSKWCYRHPRLSSSLSIASAAMFLILFLLSGLFARQRALNQADWVHRMDVLQQRVPYSMAMLTSLEAFPELEAEVVSDLEKTFSLLETSNAISSTSDPRWVSREMVSDTLFSDVRQMAWIATQRSWKKSPSVPSDFDLDEILKVDRSRLEPLLLQKERNFGAAIKILKKQVDLNPQDYVGWWLLGDCYLATQDLNNAMQAYTVCIALHPKEALPYLNRGMARYAASLYEGAAEDYQTSKHLAPSWHFCLLNRALALQSLGRIDEAISELNDAIILGYETVSTHRLRGELHTAKGDLPSAQLDFMNALQCTPKTDQHWIDRGLILLNVNPSQAVEAFENALKANPISIDAHQKLAYVYSELLANPDVALEHSNHLVELAPNEPTHLAGRAVLHARANRGNEALKDLKQLETMRLNDPMVIYQVACGYSILAAAATAEAENPYSKSALNWFAKAAKGDPAIVALAMSDPDVAWIRQQAQFHKIVTAIESLRVAPE